MTASSRRALSSGILIVVACISAGCGNDSASGPIDEVDPTGPTSGDVSFAPSFENIGTERSTQLTLSNTSLNDLRSVVVGLDVIRRTDDPSSLCTTIAVNASPSSIALLSPGAEVVIEVAVDTRDADPEDCSASEYDALLFAETEGTVVGKATVRFDWDPLPRFGEITFTPSFENIGSGRSIQLVVRNASSDVISGVSVGLDALRRATMPDATCSSILVGTIPNYISSLDPGEEVSVGVGIDTQNTDLEECPPGQYDADIIAGAGSTVLGGATIRFDWDGTPP